MAKASRSVALAALMMTVTLTGCLVGGPDDVEALDTASTEGRTIFSTTDVFDVQYSDEEYLVGAPALFDVGEQTVTLVPSDLDGEDIMIYVMRPDVPEGETVPVILDAGPYFPPMEGRDERDSTLAELFVKRGYAVAFMSVRGTGDSGGCMDLMGPAERHDIDQAVTWLGTQDWSNGNVGMFGGSYDGSTQWQAASTGNPHLRTIVPLAAIPDLFSFMVHNGTAMAWTPAQFNALYYGAYGPVNYNPLNGRSVDHMPQQVICPSSWEGMITSTTSTLTGERDPLGYWEARDWRDEVLENYEGSIFVIHGFQDITVEPHTAYPFVNQLEDKGLVVKHMLGPWGHQMAWRGDAYDIILHWYDRWLKEDPTVDIGPKVQVLDNEGTWRSDTSWPPEDATPTAYHLHPDGALDQEPAPDGTLAVAPVIPVQHPETLLFGLNSWWKVWEQPFMEICPECPTFTTGQVNEDLRFAGIPRLDLTVTTTGPGGHVTALLAAVDEDGNAVRVGMGSMDVRFADGGEAATLVGPAETVEMAMELEPTDAVVPAGSELVLVLHQGSYGLRMPPAQSFPVQLELGGGQSSLTLPVIVRGADAFHDAPDRIGSGPPR